MFPSLLTDFYDSWYPRRGMFSDYTSDDKSYKIQLELPGVDKTELSLDVEGDSLVLSIDSDRLKGTKRFLLNNDCDLDSMSAELKNGLLNITINKLKKNLKKIEIK